MRIHYTGKLNSLTPAEQNRLATRFVRLGKQLDRGSEKEAHVILGKDKRGHSAEITVNHKHHALAGKAEGADQLAVLTAALDKLETQLLKLKSKRTEGKRGGSTIRNGVVAEPVAEAPQGPQVFRAKAASKKPITVDEAVMLIGKKPYLAYRDADSGAVNVLVRRADGNFDLIEG